MLKKISIFIVSLFITIVLANTIGYRTENFETQLYRKIYGKQKQQISFDTSGIPIVEYEGDLGRQYNIVTVAEYAIGLSNKPDSMKDIQFYKCINWLIQKGIFLNDSSIIYRNHYNWPGYNMSTPWRSAMNQGRVMQAFLKAFEKTADSSYLGYARKSMNTLYTQVKDGGVTYIDNTGYWYEEYSDDSVPQSRVLNGMIVVLQALTDFHKVTNDPKALFLFNKGVATVKSSLHLYDNNGHSNYDILGKPANSWYHKFHIELMGFLYTQTHDPIFNEYKQKWEKYKEPSYFAVLIHKPSRINLFVVFSLFAGVLFVVSLLAYFFWFRKNKVGRV